MKAIPVTIRGVKYRSLEQASLHLGVNILTIKKAVESGTIDEVEARRVVPPRMSVFIRGKLYPSARDAAKALGLSRTSIYHALAHGREDTVGLGVHTPHKGKQLSFAGKRFLSYSAVDRFLGNSIGYTGKTLRTRENGLLILEAAVRKKIQAG